MITGAHCIIYSTRPKADRAFFRDVLKFPHVDVGSGWLIFGLPAAELAVHPAGNNNVHETYLMCDDVAALMLELSEQDISCSDIETMSWGSLTRITLPGGGSIGVYQPRHETPAATG